MIRRAFVLAGLAVVLSAAQVAEKPSRLPRIRVSDNHRFLVDESGKPFFYLADTAWELFHRLNRDEAVEYLTFRASQGYTAIQAVALAEEDGIGIPNAYGDLPLVDRDPLKPAVTPGANPKDARAYDYWDHVDYIVDQANARGLYVALLPTWGRWVQGDKPRKGDEALVTPANAQQYGEFLGKRYGKKGVIWVFGGDRDGTGQAPVWRAMAKGIAIGVNGKEDYHDVLITLHPDGGTSSSQWFHDEPWLAFNMQQTGHSRAERTQCWNRIAKDYERASTKPVIDGEPLYEDHPLEFRAKDYGYSFDAHVRQRAYWDLFSGACGHTYGNHAVWQMFDSQRTPVNGPLMIWREAIRRPGAAQMAFAKRLIESRPVLSRVPDPSMIVNALEGSDHIVATRGDGYAFVYSAEGRAFTVRLGKISGDQIRASWMNPRDGTARDAGTFANGGEKDFKCPSEGFASDWVLVLDDTSKHYPVPDVRSTMTAKK